MELQGNHKLKESSLGIAFGFLVLFLPFFPFFVFVFLFFIFLLSFHLTSPSTTMRPRAASLPSLGTTLHHVRQFPFDLQQAFPPQVVS